MKEEKNIPYKNYIILSIILILSIAVVIYFYMWYSEFENSKINTPILDEYLRVINYIELDNYLVENKNFVLYVSVLDDKTRNFENKFKYIIEKYSLNNSLLYLDLTEESRNAFLYETVLNEYRLMDLPCIVIFDNGNISDVYSIDDNKYDIDLLISFFRLRGIIND